MNIEPFITLHVHLLKQPTFFERVRVRLVRFITLGAIDIVFQVLRDDGNNIINTYDEVRI